MKFNLLNRGYCHLCDDMLQALRVWLQQNRPALTAEIEIVDVDAFPELVAQWDEKVPVLFLEGRYVCHYFLDNVKLAELIP